MSKILDKNILICPNCKSDKLSFLENELSCLGCHYTYKIENGKYIFKELKLGDITDKFDKVKYSVKKYSKFYDFLINTFSPVFADKYQFKFIKKYCSEKDIIAINLGSGNSDLSEFVSNADIIDYDNVNLVCDIDNLPLKDNSCDVIMNIAVLEHVKNPEKIVDEIFRVLKKGGKVFSFFPFIQGFHASPYDFSRRTIEGTKYLYKDFNDIDVRIAGGPTSGLLWIFQEYLAIIFSFGSKRFHDIILIILMIFTFPIKYLDLIFRYLPTSKNIASGFYYTGEKL
jgi:SAM-dependent methyltransferase